jgi:toxin ParE1/3/4
LTHKIVVSAAARTQIADLYVYIAESASPDTAFRFTTAILDQLGALETFPNLCIARDDILPGLRTVGFRKRVTVAFVVESPC